MFFEETSLSKAMKHSIRMTKRQLDDAGFARRYTLSVHVSPEAYRYCVSVIDQYPGSTTYRVMGHEVVVDASLNGSYRIIASLEPMVVWDERSNEPAIEIKESSSFVPVSMLTETNRRLNRRCQKAESELVILRGEIKGFANILEVESKRVTRYVDFLRELFNRNKVYHSPSWVKCRWCRFKYWVRIKVWNWFHS